MSTVLVTRPKHQALSFVNELERYGLISTVFPTIEIRPVPGWQVPDLSFFRGVFFTSPNSVQFFICIHTSVEIQRLLPSTHPVPNKTPVKYTCKDKNMISCQLGVGSVQKPFVIIIQSSIYIFLCCGCVGRFQHLKYGIFGFLSRLKEWNCWLLLLLALLLNRHGLLQNLWKVVHIVSTQILIFCITINMNQFATCYSKIRGLCECAF